MVLCNIYVQLMFLDLFLEHFKFELSFMAVHWWENSLAFQTSLFNLNLHLWAKCITIWDFHKSDNFHLYKYSFPRKQDFHFSSNLGGAWRSLLVHWWTTLLVMYLKQEILCYMISIFLLIPKFWSFLWSQFACSSRVSLHSFTVMSETIKLEKIKCPWIPHLIVW